MILKPEDEMRLMFHELEKNGQNPICELLKACNWRNVQCEGTQMIRSEFLNRNIILLRNHPDFEEFDIFCQTSMAYDTISYDELFRSNYKPIDDPNERDDIWVESCEE